MMRTKCLFAHSPSLTASMRCMQTSSEGKHRKPEVKEDTKASHPPHNCGWMDSNQPRALWALGDLMAWDTLSEMRRGPISRLVSSGYPTQALPKDKYVLCGKKAKQKKKKMGREPETNQTFHRTFADNKAEECRGRKNLPQREERKKWKPSVLTFAKEGENTAQTAYKPGKSDCEFWQSPHTLTTPHCQGHHLWAFTDNCSCFPKPQKAAGKIQWQLEEGD